MRKIYSTHFLDETINSDNLPLIAGVTSDVKDQLNAQLEHLCNVSESQEEQELATRFKNMADGARTVLNILENTSWGKSGTTNWLSTMDKSQLEFAKKEAERMIKAKNDESRESLYYATCFSYTFVTPIESKANDWIFEQLEKTASKEKRVIRHRKKNPFTEMEYTVGVERRSVLLSEINSVVNESELVPDEYLGSSDSFRGYVKEANLKCNKTEYTLSKGAPPLCPTQINGVNIKGIVFSQEMSDFFDI